MTLYDMVIESFPELAENPMEFAAGSIRLQNDGDGDYIAKWEYSQPLPEALQSYLK
jgi:hypothetical protein